ncbi:MAG: hypothetical protein ABR529_06770 [Actinomycetota bacterium]
MSAGCGDAHREKQREDGVEREKRDQGDEERPDVQERSEPEQPPVDGPSAGSGGENDDADLGDTSYGGPKGSG